MTSKTSASAGNVLFLILIAVALFAALSYAVTSSNRTSGGDVSKEQVKMLTNQMQQFKSTLTQAYMRLRTNGCSRESIHFNKLIGAQHQTYINGTFGGSMAGDGSTSVANSSCDLFSGNGGGVILPYPGITGPSYLATYFSKPGNQYSALQFYNSATVVSTPASDLFVIIQLMGTDDITVKVCEEINRAAGLPTSTSNTTAGMSADILTPIYNMVTGNQMNTDMFCDSTGIYIVLDPR